MINNHYNFIKKKENLEIIKVPKVEENNHLNIKSQRKQKII